MHGDSLALIVKGTREALINIDKSTTKSSHKMLIQTGEHIAALIPEIEKSKKRQRLVFSYLKIELLIFERIHCRC